MYTYLVCFLPKRVILEVHYDTVRFRNCSVCLYGLLGRFLTIKKNSHKLKTHFICIQTNINFITSDRLRGFENVLKFKLQFQIWFGFRYKRKFSRSL